MWKSREILAFTMAWLFLLSLHFRENNPWLAWALGVLGPLVACKLLHILYTLWQSVV